MDLSKIEEGNPQLGIKKESVLSEKASNHSSDIKFLHEPMIAQQNVPLSRLSPQDDRNSLSKPKTPPLLQPNIKVVIEKASPNLIPVRSPLISTSAAPFRSRTPSPLNP